MGCNASMQVGLENVNSKPVLISLLGLSDAGKTSIVEYLAGEYNANDPPIHTNGILLRDLSVHNVLFRISDVGGNGASISDLKEAVENSNAIIFVFNYLTLDSNVSSVNELLKISAPIINSKKIPVVVFTNKVTESDLNSAYREIEPLISGFIGSDISKKFIQMGKIDDQVYSAFQWIYDNVSH